MQFEIQKFAAVTIDDEAIANKAITATTDTTYTIEEKDSKYTVGVADGDYTVSGGTYTVTVANSEVTAVQTVDGETVENSSWTTVLASASVIVPASEDGETTSFTITAGEAGGSVLNQDGTAISGTTTVTIATADDGTYTVSLTDGKISSITQTVDGETTTLSEDDWPESITQPGATSTETTNVPTASTTTVSYATFTLQGYSTATYAVEVNGNTISLTKDGQAVTLGEGNTFTETGTGETYTISYNASTSALSVTSDKGNSVASEDIVTSEAYLKATFVVDGATLSADFDPLNDHYADSTTITFESTNGATYKYLGSNTFTITTTTNGEPVSADYKVAFGSDTKTATITPMADGQYVPYAVTSDTAVAVANKATIDGFEVTFDNNGKLSNVVYMDSPNTKYDSLDSDAGTFMFLSINSNGYTISADTETATVGSGANATSSTIVNAVTLTSYMKNGDAAWTLASETDVVSVSSDTELSGLTIVNGKVASVNASSDVWGSDEVASITGDNTFTFGGRTFTVAYDTTTNVATVTVDKGAAVDADIDGITYQAAADSVAAEDSATITVNEVDYKVAIADNTISAIYDADDNTVSAIEGYTLAYNSEASIVTATETVEPATETVSVSATESTALEGVASITSAQVDELGTTAIVIGADGNIVGAFDTQTNADVDVSASGATFKVDETTYTVTLSDDKTSVSVSGEKVNEAQVISGDDINVTVDTGTSTESATQTVTFTIGGTDYVFTVGEDGALSTDVEGVTVDGNTVTIVTAATEESDASTETYTYNYTAATDDAEASYQLISSGSSESPTYEGTPATVDGGSVVTYDFGTDATDDDLTLKLEDGKVVAGEGYTVDDDGNVVIGSDGASSAFAGTYTYNTTTYVLTGEASLNSAASIKGVDLSTGSGSDNTESITGETDTQDGSATVTFTIDSYKVTFTVIDETGTLDTTGTVVNENDEEVTNVTATYTAADPDNETSVDTVTITTLDDEEGNEVTTTYTYNYTAATDDAEASYELVSAETVDPTDPTVTFDLGNDVSVAFGLGDDGALTGDGTVTGADGATAVYAAADGADYTGTVTYDADGSLEGAATTYTYTYEASVAGADGADDTPASYALTPISSADYAGTLQAPDAGATFATLEGSDGNTYGFFVTAGEEGTSLTGASLSAADVIAFATAQSISGLTTGDAYAYSLTSGESPAWTAITTATSTDDSLKIGDTTYTLSYTDDSVTGFSKGDTINVTPSAQSVALTDDNKSTPTASSAFDGIAYYKVTFTTATSLTGNSINGSVVDSTIAAYNNGSVNSSLSSFIGTDVDGNLPGAIANYNSETRTALGMGNKDGYKSVVYGLAVDSIGSYIDVTVTGSTSTALTWDMAWLESDKNGEVGGRSMKLGSSHSELNQSLSSFYINGASYSPTTVFASQDSLDMASFDFSTGTKWIAYTYTTATATGGAATVDGTNKILYTGNLDVKVNDTLTAVVGVTGGSVTGGSDQVWLFSKGEDGGTYTYNSYNQTLGSNNEFAVGNDSYSIYYATSGADSNKAIALPTWAFAQAASVMSGDVQLYNNVDLNGDGSAYVALAVDTSTSVIAAAAYDSDGSGTTVGYTSIGADSIASDGKNVTIGGTTYTFDGESLSYSPAASELTSATNGFYTSVDPTATVGSTSISFVLPAMGTNSNTTTLYAKFDASIGSADNLAAPLLSNITLAKDADFTDTITATGSTDSISFEYEGATFTLDYDATGATKGTYTISADSVNYNDTATITQVAVGAEAVIATVGSYQFELGGETGAYTISGGVNGTEGTVTGTTGTTTVNVVTFDLNDDGTADLTITLDDDGNPVDGDGYTVTSETDEESGETTYTITVTETDDDGNETGTKTYTYDATDGYSLTEVAADENGDSDGQTVVFALSDSASVTFALGDAGALSNGTVTGNDNATITTGEIAADGTFLYDADGAGDGEAVTYKYTYVAGTETNNTSYTFTPYTAGATYEGTASQATVNVVTYTFETESTDDDLTLTLDDSGKVVAGEGYTVDDGNVVIGSDGASSAFAGTYTYNTSTHVLTSVSGGTDEPATTIPGSLSGSDSSATSTATATIGDYTLTFDATGAITSITGGDATLGEDGKSFTDGDTTYSVTYALGADGSLGGGDDSISYTSTEAKNASATALSEATAIRSAGEITATATIGSYVLTFDPDGKLTAVSNSENEEEEIAVDSEAGTFTTTDAVYTITYSNGDGTVGTDDDALSYTITATATPLFFLHNR